MTAPLRISTVAIEAWDCQTLTPKLVPGSMSHHPITTIGGNSGALSHRSIDGMPAVWPNPLASSVSTAGSIATRTAHPQGIIPRRKAAAQTAGDEGDFTDQDARGVTFLGLCESDVDRRGYGSFRRLICAFS